SSAPTYAIVIAAPATASAGDTSITSSRRSSAGSVRARAAASTPTGFSPFGRAKYTMTRASVRSHAAATRSLRRSPPSAPPIDGPRSGDELAERDRSRPSPLERPFHPIRDGALRLHLDDSIPEHARRRAQRVANQRPLTRPQ